MKILGIDPGSTVSGFAILDVDRNTARLVEAGVLRPSRSAPFGLRLAEIASGLDALIASYAPDEAAVEDLFHALHARSSLRLAHARGAILCVIARAGIPTFEYTPLQVKKAVSGYGLADKDSLRGVVEALLRVPAGLLTRDSSDAAAIALCHFQAAPVRAAIAAAAGREAAFSAGREARAVSAPQDEGPARLVEVRPPPGQGPLARARRR